MTPNLRNLHPVHRSTHPSYSALDADVVTEIAAGLAAASTSSMLATDAAPTRHHVEKLLATDIYDAWLLYWPPYSTGLWMPGAVPGVVAVVDGAVRLTAASEHGLNWRNIAAGETARVDGMRQWLANPFAAPSTTVHVYSPAIGVLHVGNAA